MGSTIDTTLGVAPRPAVAQRLAELREAIDKTVGTTFFGPMLRTMRGSSLNGTVGHGGRGEEIFQNQLDQVFAERIGTAESFDLNQALYERFARRVAVAVGGVKR